MTNDEIYMREAIAEAQIAASLGEVPIGAVVVWDGEIVARAHNTRETEKTALGHAECSAIAAACKALGGWRLHRATLYVTLEPCPMCAGAIVMAGVDAVYYGAADARAGCAGSVYALPEDPAFGKKIPCMGGMMAQRCTEILDGFFEERRG